jgi:predicted DNA-binding antitoxin AbrB/MazE fold protein
MSLMRTFEVLYEDGVLKPEQPLPFSPGQKLNITVVFPSDPKRWDLARLAEPPSDDEKYLTEAGLKEWADMLDEEDRRSESRK